MGIGRRLGLAFAMRRMAGARGVIAARARAADWFAVVVEILAVVLSIFLAFQVDRWWEHARNREAERLYLRQVGEEAGENLKKLRERQSEHQGVVRDLLAIHRAADNPDALRRLAAQPDFACGMLRLAAVRLAQSGYQDLSSGERLETLHDAELRARLRTAATYHGFVSSQLEYFRRNFGRHGEILDPYIRYRVEPGTGAFTCSVDLVDLAANPAAMSTLSRVYRDHTQFLTYRTEEADAVEAVGERVACLLSEQGCPRPPGRPRAR